MTGAKIKHISQYQQRGTRARHDSVAAMTIKDRARRLIYTLSDALSPVLPPLSRPEASYLAQLRADISASPVVGEADAEWNQNVITLRQHILHDDPREFLRWPLVMRTMAATFEPYVLRELAFLRRHNWRRWRGVIAELGVGHPYRYPLYPRSSGNLIHQAHHIGVFERTSGQFIPRLDSIAEFGGGYGCLCSVTRRLGYEGPYVIFDLPEFSALQRYYLRNCGIADVVCLSELAALRTAIKAMPHHRNSLFIATWSVSEAPLETRNAVLELVEDFGWFLIAYQNAFAGVDNERFFGEFASRRADLAWTRVPIRRSRSAYLVGRLKR